MQIQGQRILIFGDSLSHHGSDSAPPVFEAGTAAPTPSVPGDLLAALLLKQGAAAVRIDARVGRSAYNFFAREAWQDLLTADVNWRPSIVLVMLGTNDLGMGVSITKQRMTQIRDSFPSATVIGVGPPSFRSAKDSNDAVVVVHLMREVFPNFIDSRPLTADMTTQGRAADGVHFNSSGAKAFSERLLLALTGNPSPTLPESGTAPARPPPTSNFSLSNRNLYPLYVGLGVGVVGVGLVAYVAHRRK